MRVRMRLSLDVIGAVGGGRQMDAHGDDYDELTGYFGPKSVTWSRAGEAALLLGGGRAVLMQLAHPLVAAGVGQHSGYAKDPWRRTAETTRLMLLLTFGARSQAHAAARQINRLHAGVTGALAHSAGDFPAGASYHARDPELLLWVYATLIDTTRLMTRLLLNPLSPAQEEQYYQESKRIVALLGLPASRLPGSLADFDAYMEGMLTGPHLAWTPEAAQVARSVMHMPAPLALRPALLAAEQVTIGLLPPRIRDLYGFHWDRYRQAALDLSFASLRLALMAVPAPLRQMPFARAAHRRTRSAG